MSKVEIKRMALLSEDANGQAYLHPLKEFEQDLILKLLSENDIVKGIKIEPVTFKPISNEPAK